MMGEMVQSRRGSYVLPVVCTAIAVAAYISAGTLSDSQAAIARALSLPTLLGIAVAMLPGRTWRARFLDDAIEKQPPRPMRVEFSPVQAFQIIQPSGRGSGHSAVGGLVLDGVGGRLRIPARLSHPLADVIEYIGRRIGFGGARAIDSRLVEYCRTNEQTFGEERVYTFCARTTPGERYGKRPVIFGLVFIAVALLLGGVAKVRGEPAEEYAMGCVLSPIPFVAILLGLARRSGVPRPLENGSVVVTPVGLALVQGRVVGQLEWSELRDIRYGGLTHTRGSFELSISIRGLQLLVEGAQIGIGDIYDRPISFMNRIIRLYWKGSAACDACGAVLTPATGPACPACRVRLGGNAPVARPIHESTGLADKPPPLADGDTST